MAKGLRSGLGSLGAKLNRRIDRSLARETSGGEDAMTGDMPGSDDVDVAGRAAPSMDLAPEEPLSSLADKLDIGATAYVAGPTYGFDIDIVHVPLLFAASPEHGASSRRTSAPMAGFGLPTIRSCMA
jgi:hypothetical protein